ncbi:phormicin-like [Rhagoletis pomonella]|uniref:phormicin-like n=1 Tax=Rhagoletis pomonella TaxID=28610 RepID=UPI00177EBDD3|nr:phormicin-like [Rhagoletis pomonella]
MKTILLFAGLICAFCLFTSISAEPAESANDGILDKDEVNPLRAQLEVNRPEHLSRQRRFTCDVLQSKEACIFHCLLLGRRSGYCSRGGVCICRL